MSIRVLVNDHPYRTLALATDSYVLLFKHVSTNHGLARTFTSATIASKEQKAETPRCMVEFLQKSAIDLKGYRTLTTAKGTLGLITLGDDVFVCVATGSREVATVRPDETVQQLFAVEFYCLNRSDYDHAGGYGAGYRDGYREPNPSSYTLFDDEHGYESGETASEHPFMALKKVLSGGSFYYSYNFDLTKRLQDRLDADTTIDIASLDEGLLWNSYMINPLLSFRSRLTDQERDALDHSSLLTSVIRGYVGTMTVPQSANPIRSVKSNYPATLTVISRLSSRRAGTRFNARGIDDNGNVANFVETETVFWSPTGTCFSYVQVRGSVPLFWESSSTLIPGQQKIQITRSSEATQLSFDRHFDNMTHHYGDVHVVNLLSETKPGEAELTERYNAHLARRTTLKQELDDMAEMSKHDLIRKTEFDFHEVSRAAGGYDGAKKIKPLIAESSESFVYFLTQDIVDEVEEKQNGRSVRKTTQKSVMVMQQSGVFRTNCLDCLDRTNLVQGIISQSALELFLEHRGEVASSSNLSVFWMRHSALWADNGDALSKIYAGTGALKSSFTRHGKMSFGGLMADARKSATRLYVNHFEDKYRQNTTDLLLGRLVGQEEVELFDPVSDWVQDRMRQRADEYESSEIVHVWVGTYNLNGKMMRDASELQKWLNVRKDNGYGIVVVGFQEIVELSPQQIMNTDPARRTIWEQAVKATINAYSAEQPEDQYVLLRSGQLVGAALMIFVKVSMLSKIKNVEGAIKKTGVSGLAGNKGAVAIRMDVEGSSVCFVTAHLAAGFGNYDERNRDYQTIISGLHFQRDRKIEDHEVVIWLGDFNYRIGTKPEYARELIDVYRQAGGRGSKAQNALHDLYNNDQLNIQMVAGQTFPFYQEGAIKFLPTYKFDLGSDIYDSSEKARIPAWTDRILYKVDTAKGTDMRQTEYSSVMNLRFSDHRPVYSTFNVQIRVVDEQRKSELLKELYAKRNRQLRDDIEDEDSESEFEEITGYKSIDPGLPPASSDKRKWWIDGDKPVSSKVGPPQDGMKLNPARHGNPWREGGEDDWVVVDTTGEQSKAKVPTSAKAIPTSSISPAPLPPPPRRSGGTITPTPQSSKMAGAWPQSRNVSGVEMVEPQPAPFAPDQDRNSQTQIQSRTSASPGTSQASTTSGTNSLPEMTVSSPHSRSNVKPPIRPSKPPALSAQPTGSSRASASSIGMDMRSQRVVSQNYDDGKDDSIPELSSRARLTYTNLVSPALPAKPKRLSSISLSPSADQLTSSPGDEAVADKRPPLPKRTATATSVASTSSQRTLASVSGPPLPPRGGRNDQKATNQDRDLLGKDAGSELDIGSGSWKPLLPTR